MMFYDFALVFFALVAGFSDPDLKEIQNILERQQACWNKGDIDCFMKGYWESEELQFIGKSGVTQGYAATKARYHKSYPDAKAMGILDFTILSMEKLSRKNVLVVGKWHLLRTEGDLEGHFSLLWKNINGEWVIVVDHSS